MSLRLVDDNGNILVSFDDEDISDIAQNYNSNWLHNLVEAVADWAEEKGLYYP